MCVQMIDEHSPSIGARVCCDGGGLREFGHFLWKPLGKLLTVFNCSAIDSFHLNGKKSSATFYYLPVNGHSYCKAAFFCA